MKDNTFGGEGDTWTAVVARRSFLTFRKWEPINYVKWGGATGVVDVKGAKGGATASFRLVAIHLHHRFADVREKEAIKVVSSMQWKTKNDRLPLLVMGDMNESEQTGNAVAVLKEGLCLADTHARLARRKTSMVAFDEVLDYMLYSKDHFAVTDQVATDTSGYPEEQFRQEKDHNGWAPSDHYPVKATLQLV